MKTKEKSLFSNEKGFKKEGFMSPKFFAVLLSFFFVISVPWMYSSEKLTILHVNDTHSHIVFCIKARAEAMMIGGRV
ncbi:MAG: hypothetical protein H8E54_11090, partial [Candidatus Aminicenantes bacterium]|nr:hypothetical protein [Candidatus Aminicenantes bacterium]